MNRLRDLFRRPKVRAPKSLGQSSAPPFPEKWYAETIGANITPGIITRDYVPAPDVLDGVQRWARYAAERAWVRAWTGPMFEEESHE